MTTPVQGTSFRDGAIAASVGLVVGLLLCALGVWCTIEWQRRTRPKEDSRPSSPRIRPPPRIAVAGGPMTRITDFHLWGGGDGSVKRGLERECWHFEHHADRFYHEDALSEIPDNFDAALERLCLGEAVTAAIKPLILDPKTRVLAINHLLVRVVLSSVSVHSIGPLSVLPSFVNDFIPSLPVTYKDVHDPSLLALTTWRVITAYLMQPVKLHRPPLTTQEYVEPQIQALLAALNDVVKVFATQDRVRKDCPFTQETHLERVTRSAIEWGFQIFSHPAEWKLIWEPEPTYEQILIYPGLAKLSDENAEPYEEPQMFQDLPEVRDPHEVVIHIPAVDVKRSPEKQKKFEEEKKKDDDYIRMLREDAAVQFDQALGAWYHYED
ncbi:hypothetical protein NOR_00004 [Metarhizium rileyi]|uniref:Uncharacterized protein n=1 Tax=Metarhizium rileyi (strain RCEF 4871) TaxID=1649241 RepID=A0A167K9I0_METRR|nr:hypothetical protein NOR_00004 [Metarhizium rileyi RCEF 4871]